MPLAFAADSAQRTATIPVSAGTQDLQIQVYEGGFVGVPERLLDRPDHAVEQVPPATQVVILDARRIGRATAGAVSLLVTLRDDPTVGPTILVAGAPQSLLDALAQHGGAWTPKHVVADVDLAIEQGEDIVLAAVAAVAAQIGRAHV